MADSIRQALVIALSGFALLVVVFTLLRQQLLSFRYATGWAAIGLIAVLGSLLAWVVSPLARLLGMTPTGLLLASVSLLLLGITLLLTIAVSRNQERIRDLAEALALAGNLSRNQDVPPEDQGLLVIVPAFNEQATVGGVVTDLSAHGYRVLVVDDGSHDLTAMRARAAGAKVLELPMNLGVGGALRAGFRYAVQAGFTSVVQCDADGQHIASEISTLLTVAGGDSADMVIGTRFDSESPEFSVRRYRRVAMRLLARLASRATDTDISDATSGFRLIRQPLLSAFARQFPSHYLGDTFEALVAAGKAGYRVAEVPVQMRERQSGESSASFAVAARLTLRALILASGGTSFRLASQRR